MTTQAAPSAQTPVRIGIAGLSHDHVHWLFRRQPRNDITVVGIAEPSASIRARYQQQYGIAPNLLFDNLETMLDVTKPAAVMAFGSIFDHYAAVAACAPRGVHVMVEKPLAVNPHHAEQMAILARQHQIHLLTNYETTWYASNHTAYTMACTEARIGEIRKVVVHDGHWGPHEIGCSADFLAWLTDPVLNGGGALIDFGCYGANLMTWLMGNVAPQTVIAVTQQIKPAIYPKVDDEATIILTYPQAQCIIQASWNWPYHRKDLEIYGQIGYLYAVDRQTVRLRENVKSPEQSINLPAQPAPYDDPFAYLAAVVSGEVTVAATDLSALANNLIVVRILDAARTAAQQGRTITLS
jgi:predicted dehydrogenase